MIGNMAKNSQYKNLDLDALSFGDNQANVMIIVSSPCEEDVDERELLSGEFGDDLRKAVRKALKLSVEQDCFTTAVLNRVVKEKKYPSKLISKLDRDKLDALIRLKRPELIVCIGSYAQKHILVECPGKIYERRLHGRVLKSITYGCNVACLYDGEGEYNYDVVLRNDLRDICSILTHGRKYADQFDRKTGNIQVASISQMAQVLTALSQDRLPISFDYEATTLNPFDPSAKTLTVSVCNTFAKSYCLPLQHPGSGYTEDDQNKALNIWREFVTDQNNRFVVQNYQFESVWTKHHFGEYPNIVYDTMLGYHVIDGRKEICGLGFQVYEHTGYLYKEMVDVTNLINEPLELVAEYNNLDARYTLMLYFVRSEFLQNNEWASRATDFAMRTVKTSAKMQYRGVGIDRAEVLLQLENNIVEIARLFKILKSSAVVRGYELSRGVDIYHRLSGCGLQNEDIYFFGVEDFEVYFANKEYINDKDLLFTTFDKKKTINDFLYKFLKLKSVRKTASGQNPNDEEAMQCFIDNASEDVSEVLDSVLMMRKCSKLITTYLSTYESMTRFESVIHPTYALHTTETNRSSYFDPNLQNIPKRTEKGKVIRRCFVPKLDLFLDGDFKGAEVKTFGMYTQDERLVYELVNDIDFHTYWSARVFNKKESEVTKSERDLIKQNFVFLLFYGGWYVTSALALGLPKEWIEKLEKALWDRYPEVKQWQQRVWKFYKKYGYIENKLGFRRYGPLKRRHVINTPIQGSSFQLLSLGMTILTEDMDSALKKYNFDSHIVLQIHDELVLDCTYEEVADVLELADGIFSKQHYDWQGSICMSVDWRIGEKNFAELVAI